MMDARGLGLSGVAMTAVIVFFVILPILGVEECAPI